MDVVREEGHRYTYSTRGIPLLSSISLLNDSVMKVLRPSRTVLFLTTPLLLLSSERKNLEESAARGEASSFMMMNYYYYIIYRLFRLEERKDTNAKFPRINISCCFWRESVTILFSISRFSIKLFCFVNRDVITIYEAIWFVVSKEFRGINHRGKEGEGEKEKSYRPVRIERVVSSPRLQWRRSGVHYSNTRDSRERNEI